MRYLTIISIITIISFGASGSSSTVSTATEIKPLEYTSLIKTSEEMYKTSEELLNQLKSRH